MDTEEKKKKLEITFFQVFVFQPMLMGVFILVSVVSICMC